MQHFKFGELENSIFDVTNRLNGVQEVKNGHISTISWQENNVMGALQ